MTDHPEIKGNIAGTHEEVAAYLKRVYPTEIISVIVWTTGEVKDMATENDLELSDQEAFEVIESLALNEDHEYGENRLSAMGYIWATKGIE